MKIKVTREAFTGESETYYGYYVYGNIRGIDVKAQVIPLDFGGYAVLDIVYDGEDEAELVTEDYTYTAKDGAEKVGKHYKVVTYDSDGKAYECPVKPAKRSDKTLINVLSGA